MAQYPQGIFQSLQYLLKKVKILFFTTRPIYGSFYHTVQQTAAAINTAYPMIFGTTDVSNGISVVTNGTSLSRITVDTTAKYLITVSAQLWENTVSTAQTVDVWLRVNGVDIANTNRKVEVEGVVNFVLFTNTWVVSIPANQYVEIMWSTNSTAVELRYDAITSPHPATPSTMATIQKISN
jgi:hypothetical protein